MVGQLGKIVVVVVVDVVGVVGSLVASATTTFLLSVPDNYGRVVYM